MKALSKHIKQALSALAAADAGEMLTRRQMDRVLHRPDHALQTPRRQVALWCTGTPGNAALEYAQGVCKRIDADLVCLHDENGDTSWLRLRQPRVAATAVTLSGHPEKALRDHIANNALVAFLVLDGEDTRSQGLSLHAGSLGVPVVLVTGRSAPKAAAASSSQVSRPIPHPAAHVVALG